MGDLLELRRFRTLVDGLDHPECVTWGPDGAVYAGGEAGQVYRVTLAGELRELGSTGGFVLGLCLDASANVYACDQHRRAVVRMAPHGSCETYADGLPERRMMTPNYAVFDPTGALLVSDSGSWDGDDGCLWTVRPGGRCELLCEQTRAFPNGLALAPDGSHLYVALSQLPGVVRLPVRDGRRTGQPERVLELAGHVPDGLAFDAAGDLWISCYTPDVIYRLTTAGSLDRVAHDPWRTTLAAPTNIAFCGPDLRTLVVASLGRWHLAAARVPTPGTPHHYPELG